jgi:transcriptional regulator with XRE-family HTH domain
MDMEYIRKRITELRIARGFSEYQLSYDSGHSKNYIHNIVTGHSQPSVKELLYLIELLGVTPRDFFDERQEFQNPILAKEIIDGIKSMDNEDLEAVLSVIKQLNKKKT